MMTSKLRTRVLTAMRPVDPVEDYEEAVRSFSVIPDFESNPKTTDPSDAPDLETSNTFDYSTVDDAYSVPSDE